MLIWILVLLVLFILIQRNNKRNMEKLRNNRSRGFRKSYYNRRKENPYSEKEEHPMVPSQNEAPMDDNKNTTS